MKVDSPFKSIYFYQFSGGGGVNDFIENMLREIDIFLAFLDFDLNDE